MLYQVLLTVYQVLAVQVVPEVVVQAAPVLLQTELTVLLISAVEVVEVVLRTIQAHTVQVVQVVLV